MGKHAPPRDKKPPSPRRRNRIFGPPTSWEEFQRIDELLRKETVGGIILMLFAFTGIILANSPLQDSYFSLRDTVLGPESLHLNLSVGAWAADGLLAIFFFLVGLELKHEFVAGDLRDFRQAIVPVAAAIGGVILPALTYLLVNISNHEALHGWAIPAATDIAFAVAVLGIIGSHLPPALRIFLLTLAVVDDLIAIFIIAVFYSTDVRLDQLFIALMVVVVFAFLCHRFQKTFIRSNVATIMILLPLGIIAWYFMHASGIHATIAGVALGLSVPARAGSHGDENLSLTAIMEHRYRLLSSLVAVPVFAFFSSGINIGGFQELLAMLTSNVAIGIILGLVVSKAAGILISVLLIVSLTKARLDDSIKWVDLMGVSALAGIGFTVSMLITELSFSGNDVLLNTGKVAVMIASLIAAFAGAFILGPRNRHYKRIEAVQMADDDCDGVPNVFDDAPKDPTRS